VSADRGRVLYNGFAPERLDRAGRGDRPDSPFHIVMAATMDDRKDFPTFLAAVRRLREVLPFPVRATALGGGPNLDSWRAIASDLIEDGTVCFPGRVDEVLNYLADAHVGVLLAVPGWGEGISNSIMEYMAAELPVVCTNAGGNPELVIDGATGILIEPGDVDALVASLVSLAENRDRSEAMGQAGKLRIETVFSVQTMIANAIGIYEEAIALKGGN
jgi:glycosyltransferase involved in cell wall biosynthesis